MPQKKIFKNEAGLWVAEISSGCKVRARKTFQNYADAEKWAEEAYLWERDMLRDTL